MAAEPSGPPTAHAAAVLVGARAVLIRGPAGSGKSRLAFDLINAAASGLISFARLVADDRVHLEPCNGRLLARPPSSIAGLLEVRGSGIRRLSYEPVAVVALVVDLADPGAERLPAETLEITIAGIRLPRLAVASGMDAMPQVLAHFRTAPAPV